MAVTLHDVAKLAGVSVGTASQALNNNPKVTAETRSRVVDAANTLGYVFKERRGRENYADETHISVIGVLAKHDIDDDQGVANPFYSHIYAGAESACRQHGVGLMFSTIEVDETNRPVIWPAMLKSGQIDALLLVGTYIDEVAESIKQQINVPIVLIDSYAPHLPFDSVLTDNIQGAGLAIEHLLGLGHEKIGIIGSSPSSSPSILDRRKGYQEALIRRGLNAEAYIENSRLDRIRGEAATLNLLERCPDLTAIFSCNDDTVPGVYKAIRKLGLKVPEDISVIGFDNIILAQELTPPLTTIHVHKNWMGILGVQFLLERVQYPEKPHVKTLVSTQLVARDSTAPPRQ